MSKLPETIQQPSEERIRAIAYQLWEDEGHPDGRDQDHWHRAVEIATAEMSDPDWLQRQVTAADDSSGTAESIESSATAELAARIERLTGRKVA